MEPWAADICGDTTASCLLSNEVGRIDGEGRNALFLFMIYLNIPKSMHWMQHLPLSDFFFVF